jgi:hypothetical protein
MIIIYYFCFIIYFYFIKNIYIGKRRQSAPFFYFYYFFIFCFCLFYFILLKIRPRTTKQLQCCAPPPTLIFLQKNQPNPSNSNLISANPDFMEKQKQKIFIQWVLSNFFCSIKPNEQNTVRGGEKS